MKKYRVIDLFSGAGGFSLGFSKAGFRVMGSIEKIPVFCNTHHQNFPDSISLAEDICSVPPERFAEILGLKRGDIDVVVGSPPCQTFSTIGVPKIKSLREEDGIETDPRNYLFKYYFDYVDYYKPSIFIMENVPMMRTRFKGHLFDRVIDLVYKLGYEPHISIVNSAEYGVPQVRKRLILVGTKDNIKFSPPNRTHYILEEENQQTLFSNEEICGLKAARTVYDAISDLPRIYDGCREDVLPYSLIDNLTDYQIIMRNENGLVGNNICRMSNERAKKVFTYMRQGSKYMDLPEEVRRILPFREDIFHDRLKRLDMSKPSWTVLAHIGMDGYMYIHPTENRTLSVREAARIQSFHDSFKFCGNMREQYVQVGNAVPPIVARVFADSIKKALR